MVDDIGLGELAGACFRHDDLIDERQSTAMMTQIALFRGINVGKANRIAMADLKLMFEDLGFRDVRTLLNSGNVVFEAGRGATRTNAKRIASALIERTGVTTNVLVVDAATLDATIAENSFAERIDDPSRLLVGFFLADADISPLEALRREFPSEHFELGKHACYLWCSNGISSSRLAEKLIGSKFKDFVTTRNWATTLKLQAMTKIGAGVR